ncbi:hypothetical protein L1987_54167 [Smallanthus sonchifolius]|uniref:Uncharacterized protein n=1 Tax=Smallanthus sonchifolius TaxID=185202 RepID=A0ACB9E635_9ASTR|nr:hypothetical protein L1987_54167 [Smallanthus sonchifolius]
MYSATHEGDKLSPHPCRVFSLTEIQSATKDFDDELVIGQGGFGKVYKGQISSQEDGHVVAIKRLDSMSSQGELEFRAEIETLSMMRHCHLVSLIGYCDDNKEMILVYEYMANGTLYHHLHKADTPLNWIQRMKIAIGAGRGLDYLHTGVGTRHGIIHRDVKSSNILLDENWEALLSDFGLSKIGPTNQSSSYVDASVKGTFGYLDPEYFYTRRLTRKTDVFAFGVVLFELLSGRLPVDIRHGEENCSLVRWAKKCVKERKLDQMVDSNIRGTIFPKCLRQFAQIAYHCLLSVPKERPTITVVVASLQAILELQRKHDNFTDSLGPTGFTWKIHKYLASINKQNSGSSTNKDGGEHQDISHQNGKLVARDLKTFTYSELKCASRNFGKDTLLGKGVHGAVYRGWIDKMTYSPCMHDTGLPIAIKRLNSYKFFDPDMLKEFCHPNLVELIGYCLEGEQIFLVYEFMRNGNLKDLLWSGTIAQLPLFIKVKIVVGMARAIVFLHKTQDEVRAYPYHTGTVGEYRLHRHKILLDEDFTAKLLDYDVTKLVHGHYPNNKDLLSDDYYPGFKSKVLTMLEEYEKYIPGIHKEAFTTTNESYISIREVFTMKGHIDSVMKLKGIDMDTNQLHYSV